MADIRENMRELEQVVKRLKELNSEAKELRGRKKQLEFTILNWLEETQNPGLKFNELIVLKKESKTRTKKKKSEKEEDIMRVLEEQGVQDPKKALNSIFGAMKGEELSKSKLSIKTTVPELF